MNPRNALLKRAGKIFLREESIIEEELEEFTLIKNLEEGRRGKPGPAGFYKSSRDGKIYFIKHDDPGTVALETTASFAKSVIPRGLESCVIFAETRKAILNHVREGTDEIIGQEEVAVSKQLKLDEKEYKTWAEVIAGEKRDPDTLRSFESSNAEKILNSINNMTDHAKNQLACAIFVSQLVGDESLHTGQFMMKVDNNIITDVTRIDFGARERFAIARSTKDDFKHKTSNLYAKSGQFGKDYISYLLKHPDIKARVLNLWLRPEKVNATTLSDEYKKELNEQIDRIPLSQRNEALQGIDETFSRGMNNQKLMDPESAAEIMKQRIISYRSTSKEKINSVLSKSNLNSSIANDVKAILNGDNIAEIIKSYNKIRNDIGDIMPAKQALKLLSHLQAKFQCSKFSSKYKNKEFDQPIDFINSELEQLKIKFQMIIDLENYLDHLNYSIFTKDKEFQVKELIRRLKNDVKQAPNDRQSIKRLISYDFKKIIPVHRINFFSNNKVTKGQELLNQFNNYIKMFNNHKNKNICNLDKFCPSSTTPSSTPVCTFKARIPNNSKTSSTSISSAPLERRQDFADYIPLTKSMEFGNDIHKLRTLEENGESDEFRKLSDSLIVNVLREIIYFQEIQLDKIDYSSRQVRIKLEDKSMSDREKIEIIERLCNAQVTKSAMTKDLLLLIKRRLGIETDLLIEHLTEMHKKYYPKPDASRASRQFKRTASN